MAELQDELDRALEAALKRYGEAPESPGIERRVLKRVRESTARRREVRSWTLAVCAVMLASCWFLYLTPARMVEQPHVLQASVQRLDVEPIAIEYRFALRTTNRRKRAVRRAEPKLARFPAPRPMSSEERALLRLVEHEKEETRRELVSLGGPVKPIQIAKVEIKPL